MARMLLDKAMCKRTYSKTLDCFDLGHGLLIDGAPVLELLYLPLGLRIRTQVASSTTRAFGPRKSLATSPDPLVTVTTQSKPPLLLKTFELRASAHTINSATRFYRSPQD